MNNADKISMLNMFIEQLPIVADKIISTAEKECFKNQEIQSLDENQKLDLIINYINEKNLLSDEIKSAIKLNNLIQFEPKSYYKDFFEIINSLNNESFFQKDSIKRKTADLKQLLAIKDLLTDFFNEYGIVYARVIKHITEIKINLSKIHSLKEESEIKHLDIESTKYLAKIEEIYQNLEDIFSESTTNFADIELFIKKIKENELINSSLEGKDILEKEFNEIYASIKDFKIEDSQDKELRMNNYNDFIDLLVEKLDILTKFNSFKNNIQFMDSENSLANNMIDYEKRLLEIIKEKINIIIPKLKVLSYQGLEEIVEKDFLKKIVEIKILAGKYSES